MANFVSGVPQQIGGAWAGITDFSEFDAYAGATPPPGVTRHTYSGSAFPNTYAVADSADPAVGRYFGFSGQTDGQSAGYFHTIDAFADLIGEDGGEVLALVWVGSQAPDHNNRLMIGPCFGRATSSQRWGASITKASSFLPASSDAIQPEGPGGTVAGSQNVGGDIGYEVWKWVRARVVREDVNTRWRIKQWTLGDTEPAGWLVDSLLASPDIDAGATFTPGVLMSTYIGQWGREQRVAVLSFSTDPDTLPPPDQTVPAVPPELREKAWAFVLDGHVFYVLNFSARPALVCDLTTGQWHRWYTRTYDPDALSYSGGMWNMFRGIVWNGRVIASDGSGSKVWELDPHSMLDEGVDPIRRAVTAFQPLRGRASARQGSMRLTATKEDLAASSTIRMRFSDDGGVSWSTWRSVVLAADSYSRRIEWRSLGRIRAPGRIWEIEDEGGLIRIEGADADIEGG